MLLCHAPANGHSYAGAFKFAAAVQPLKEYKYSIQIFFFKTNTDVGHANFCVFVIGGSLAFNGYNGSLPVVLKFKGC